MSFYYDWTADRITRLKALAADGLTASMIAAELGGVSRAAVIGKLYRMQVCLRGRPAARRAEPKGRQPYNWHAKRQALPEIPQEVIDLPPDVSPDACTLMELTDTSCRWPMGHPDKDDFRFCGTDCDPAHGPYCRRHMRLAYKTRYEISEERRRELALRSMQKNPFGAAKARVVWEANGF